MCFASTQFYFEYSFHNINPIILIVAQENSVICVIIIQILQTMFRKIAGTFFTRITVSVLNFLLIIFTAKHLGAEARGAISLCVLAIAIVSLINEIVGGPAVVHLVPRYNNKHLALLSYSWAIIVSAVFSFLLAYFNFYDAQYAGLVWLLSLLLCVGSIHQFILLGHQKIKQFNSIALLQVTTVFLVFCILYFLGYKTIEMYLYALLSGYTVSLISGLYFTRFVWKSTAQVDGEITKTLLLKNGMLTQVASITHLLSSRITYYFTTAYLSLAFVGVLSTAVSITEAALMFSTSVALITASNAANSSLNDNAAATTLQLIKLSVFISIVLLTLLCLLPESFLSWLFGKDFQGMKVVILTLIPASLAMSVSQVISHYYSGIGRYSVNTKVGVISLVVTLAACGLFVITKSVLLPGLIISVSALSAFLYFVKLFTRENNLALRDIVPNKKDFNYLKLLLTSNKNK